VTGAEIALLNKGDRAMAVAFGANALCALTIALALRKRAKHRSAIRTGLYGAGLATKVMRA
jgi:site-specific recombinase XerC